MVFLLLISFLNEYKMTELGNRIQELRKLNKLSQTELANKINLSKSQIIRYETKGVQPPADILNKLADLLNTSIDYLINGDTTEKAISSLKDVELLKQFKEIDQMPEEEKKTILKVISAYIRDFKTRQAYLI